MLKLFRRLSPILVIGAVLFLPSPRAAAEILGGVPDVIVCVVRLPQSDSAGGRMVFYVDRQVEGGFTLYSTLGGSPQQLRVSAKGLIEPGQLQDCNDKSIEELREAGRAFNLR